MDSRPNVVITGAGVVSPIGIGREPFWQSLVDQRSGVALVPELVSARAPVRIGATIRDFEPKRYVKPRKALKVMSREIQIGFSAATLAAEDAGLKSGEFDPDRVGVVYGADMLYCGPHELVDAYQRCMIDGQFDFSRWGEASMGAMYPLWMLMYLPNMIACHVGIAQDARGPNNTICQGEVSSLLALIEAANIIQRGRADAMIAGGSSSRLSLTPLVYRGYADASHMNEVPESASRPFDARRDGMVNGEGAAAFVLERESYAQARGVNILARISGWGISFGSLDEPSESHTRAIARSIEAALEAAQLGADDLGHVNAHAGGLQDQDPLEAQAIRRQLGDVPVTAPKSYFGNLGASSGMVETLVSVLALTGGQVPVTLNYEQPDPRCPVHVIHTTALKASRPTALALSQSCTGQAVAVVLAAPR